MSDANLSSVSQQDADYYVSLCWIDGTNNGEFISYQNATLTGLNRYNLTYLRRGVYGSNIMTHSAGSKFVRCDDDIALKIPYTENAIGQTYYVKFTSFNVFGTVEQDLSQVSPYTITLQGYNKKAVTESGAATLTAGVTRTISYNHVYQEAPYPQVTITDPEEGDMIYIENQTTSSFAVRFENPNLTPRTPLVVVIGDSISSGFPFTGDKPGNYPSDWASWTAKFRELSGYTVINQAVAGTTTDDCRSRFMTDVVALKPDYVIIEYGNDCGFGMDNFSRTQNNLNAISSMAKTYGIKIIFVQPVARLNMTAYGTYEELVKYKAYHERMYMAELLLGWPSLKGYYNPLDSGPDTVNLDYLVEGIHPTQEGYEIVGEWLTPQITSIIGSGSSSTSDETRNINYLVYGV